MRGLIELCYFSQTNYWIHFKKKWIVALLMIGFLNKHTALLISIPLTFFIILLELYLGHRWQKKYYTFKETKHNIMLGIIFAVVEALLSGVCIFMMVAIVSVGFKKPPSNIYLYWISLFFFEDFCITSCITSIIIYGSCGRGISRIIHLISSIFPWA